MKTKLTLLFLLFSILFFAQDANDKIVYLDSKWSPTTKDNYTYYRIIKDHNLEKSEYIIEDYYKSGVLQMKGNSETKDYLTKKGLYKYYFENGALKCEHSYDKGKETGNRTDWYENGVKSTVITKFTVDVDNKLADIENIASVGTKTDEEAIRVIRLFNKITSAKFRGINVKSTFVLPIAMYAVE
jgi:hypothetical protein